MSSNFFLFELGSTSLKFYYRRSERDPIRKDTFPLDIGHEVYESGSISEQTSDKAIYAIRAFLSCHGGGWAPDRIPAFATGAFREATNRIDFFSKIRGQTGLSVRILTEDEEAALLNAQFLRKHRRPPSLGFDLGGGWLRWVLLPAANETRWGAIPIGAVRLFRKARHAAAGFDPELAHRLAGQSLASLPRIEGPLVFGSGGPVRAISKVLGGPMLERGPLEELEQQVRLKGPPPSLKPHRQAVFLAGLILVRQIATALGVKSLHYEDLASGGALLEKIYPFYDRGSEVPDPAWIVKRISFSKPLPLVVDG